jgi:imidazolonepropionase-like amidohydrolase
VEAARLLGVWDDRGEVADGKRADLLLLNGVHLDPAGVEDRIRAVWHNGRLVGRAGAATQLELSGRRPR